MPYRAIDDDGRVRSVSPIGLTVGDLVLLGLLLTMMVSVATWAVVNGITGEATSIAGNVFVGIATLTASILTLVAALRGWRRGTGVWPWLGLTIACHVWLAGEVGRLVIERYLDRPVLVPSVIDVPLLLFAPVVVRAFLPLFRRPEGRVGRGGTLLDIVVIVLLTLLIASGPVSGGSITGGSALSTWDRVTVTLWILSALLTVLPTFPIAVAAQPPDRLRGWSLIGGFLLLGAGQVLYADALRTEPVRLSYLVTVCWTIGFGFVAVSAVIGARQGWLGRPPALEASQTQTRPFGAMASIRTGASFAMAGILGIVLLITTFRGSLTGIAVVIGAGAAIAIATRLVVSAVQTERLLREAQVSQAHQSLVREFLRLPPTDAVPDDPVGRLEAGIVEAFGVRDAQLVMTPAASTTIDAVPFRDGTRLDIEIGVPIGETGSGTLRIRTDPATATSGAVREATVATVTSIAPLIGDVWAHVRREDDLVRRLALRDGLLAFQARLLAQSTPTPADLAEGLRDAIGARWLCIEAGDGVSGSNRMVAASPGDGPMPALTAVDRQAAMDAGGVVVRREGDNESGAATSGAGAPATVLLAVRLRIPAPEPLMLTAGWSDAAPDSDVVGGLDAEALAGVAAAGLALVGDDRGPLSGPVSGGPGTLTGILGQDGDEGDVLARIADQVVRSTPARQVAMLIWSPIGDEYEVIATGTRPGSPHLFIPGERSAFSTVPTIRNALVGTGPMDVAVADTQLSPAERRLVVGARLGRLSSWPLIAGGRRLGVMVIGGASPDPWPAAVRDVFEDVASLSAVVIDRGRLVALAREAGLRDDLTGVLNQRAFQGYVADLRPEPELPGAAEATPLTFVFAQVSTIGARERTEGPGAGERLLGALVAALRAVAGPTAVAGLVGVTGIGIILPARSDPDDLARQVADRLVSGSRADDASAFGGLTVRTASVPEHAVTLAALIERATGPDRPIPTTGKPPDPEIVSGGSGR